MPKLDRKKVKITPRVDVKHNDTGIIRRVVFPHATDFGIENEPDFLNDVNFHQGLSGSLTRLTDGRSYIAAGAGVTITSASNGQILIETSAGSGTGDIQGVIAGTGISGGGNSGAVTLNLAIDEYSSVTPTKDDSFLTLDSDGSTHQLTTISALSNLIAGDGLTSTNGELIVDINELTAADINVAEDFIAFSDEGASGDPTRKESIADLMTAVAGTGLGAASGQLLIDLNELSAATVAVADDNIAFIDNDDNVTKKESISDFISAVAGTGLSESSGQLSVSSLAVAQGGTGATSFSDKSVIITQDSGTDTLAAVAMSSNGQLLIGGTSGPAVATLTAGTNINISNADGAITITATGVAPGAAGSDTQVQFNDGGSTLAGDAGLLYNKTSNDLYAAGVITASLGFTGSLTRLVTGDSYLISSGGIRITSQSNGQISIFSREYSAGDGLSFVHDGNTFAVKVKDQGGLKITLDEIEVDDTKVAMISGSTFTGGVKFKSGLSGSLNQLFDGSPFIVAGTGVSIATGSSGQITIANATTAGTGLEKIGDQFSIDDSIVATISGSNFKGHVGVTGSIHSTTNISGSLIKANFLTGSLTNLSNGISYLVGGANITITSASSGQVIINSSVGASDVVAGSDKQIQFNDGDTAFGGDSDFTYNKNTNILTLVNLTGSNVKALALTGSLTHVHDGSSYLIAGNNVAIVTQSNGSIRISSTGGSGGSGSPGGSNTEVQFNDELSFGGDSNFTFDKGSNTLSITNVTGSNVKFHKLTGSLTKLQDGSSYLIAGSNISITSQSNGSIVITGSAAGGSTIGDAEDGSYADGLFADFTSSTEIGTAIDRFNEVLKSLAPGPAPSLDDIDFNNSSVSGKLSFGASNAVSGYSNSNTTAGFSAVDVDGTFGSSTSGNNLRIGLLDGATAITGDLNEDVSADTHGSGQTNFVANSFGDANSGTLQLEVNGATIHSVEITGSDGGIHPGAGVPGSGTGSSTNSNGSGFTNLSTTGSAKFSDGTDLDLFQHRTGRYTIAAADQRSGWNYARVIHSLASGDVATNYVEWVNDPDSNALAAAGDAFDTLSMTGDVRLSGVKYFTAGTAQYRVRVTNAYKNVYSTSNITFTTSDCTINAQSFPSAGNDEDKVLHLTGSATISATTLLNESISARAVVPHPLKSNLTANNQTISNILMYNLSNNSTNVSETFRRENFRIISGSYNDQSSVTSSDNEWDGSIHLTGSNAHSDGLMFYNQRLVSPSQGANSGNFSGISNGPPDNRNYSSITSGLRTFLRYFQNNSGGSKTGFSLTINGSGTIVTHDTALNSSRLKVFVKLPETSSSQSTGFMDLATAFATGQVSDNDGCLEGSLDSSLNATNTVTFGTEFVAANEYVVVMIKADAAFTGHISQITVSWS